MRQALLQDPRGGRRYWFLVAAGTFLFFVGLYFFFGSPSDQATQHAIIFGLGLAQAGVGLGMVLAGISELMPRSVKVIVVLMRVGALSIALLSIIVALIVLFY